MAVYRKSYRGYSGKTTPEWRRFLVVARYAGRRLVRSRLLVAFVAACFLYSIGCAVYIYACHNKLVLSVLGVLGANQATLVGSTFFYVFLQVETGLALILTALAGPGLLSPDLTDQGIVLYLSRPFSRAEYLLGKWLVLLALLSGITWLPGLGLFAIQSDLAGSAWLLANLWMLAGLFFGSFYAILMLSLPALAFSAWFRRKLVAGGALLLLFILGSGFGQAVNASLRTHAGDFLALDHLMRIVQSALFRRPSAHAVSAGAAWAELALLSMLCLALIIRKIRAREVAQ